MNDAIAPFNDVNVRKALNLAIDRDYIAEGHQLVKVGAGIGQDHGQCLAIVAGPGRKLHCQRGRPHLDLHHA